MDFGFVREYRMSAALMALLIALATVDLFNQYSTFSRSSWFQEYREAIIAGDEFWQLGFRTENLELKLESQQSRLVEVKHKINSLLPGMKLDMENLRGIETMCYWW